MFPLPLPERAPNTLALARFQQETGVTSGGGVLTLSDAPVPGYLLLFTNAGAYVPPSTYTIAGAAVSGLTAAATYHAVYWFRPT